ncbi:hypothetical protein AB0M95_25145 [Sphaerisporangium sp. NPDC051017]|uniref:hypothetical protein n=1 Tax=Sphaerisporangium sp. NPDC051017 TaxID=3154636 RepID=UPI0034135417
MGFLDAIQDAGADLERFAARLPRDGAAALEWRGYATVNAVKTLLAHGRAPS